MNKGTVVKRVVVPLVLGSAALLGAMKTTEKQVLHVYADKLAKGLPTYCSGKTDWKMPIGKTFTVQECDEVDKATAVEYGKAILACTKTENLNQVVFDSLTLFAINVGKKGACDSRAVRLVNQGLLKDGCRALRHGPNGENVWVFSDGKYVQGLHNRRMFELNWCLAGALELTQ